MMPAEERNIMRPWILLFGLLAFTACDAGPNNRPVEYKPLYFTQYQPIYLAVSSIEIVDDYKPPLKPPYIEHLVPYSPSEALGIWVRDRMHAGGGDKMMQVIIRNSSVRVSGGRPTGLGGLIPFYGDNLYNAKLEVEMRIYGESVISEASIFVNATRSMVLSSTAGDDLRNKAFRKLISDMMDEFNAEMEKNLFMYMGNYISYNQMP
jgi:hypothetical protein